MVRDSIREAVQPISRRADPQAATAVVKQLRPSQSVSIERSGLEWDETSVLKPAKAALASNQDRLIGVGQQPPDRGLTSFVDSRRRIDGRHSVVPATDFSFVPHPYRSSFVLSQGVSKRATESVVFAVTPYLRAFNLAERTFVVANTASHGPDPARAILDHPVVATISLRHRGQLTAAQFREAGARSDPQAAIAGAQQRQSAAGIQFMKTIVPRFEAGAVEADKAIERAYPKEAVSRLRDGNR